MHPHHRPFSFHILAAVCLLTLAGLVAVPAAPALAQEQVGETEEGQGIFIDTVDVNVVNVDVYVTDENGEPVTGLTVDDFVLEESGRPQTITNFYAVTENMVVSRSAGPTTAEPDGATGDGDGDGDGEPAEEMTPEEMPDDERLHLVVYVDNFNLLPFDRRRVLMDVRTFLRKTVQSGDRVMLVTYDRSLNVRRSFTSDVTSVVDGLFEIDEISAQGIHKQSERRDILEKIRDSESVIQAQGWARQYAESTRNDIQFSIDAMKDIVTSLAGIPGRKAVVYVSSGLPMIAGEDIFYYINQKFHGSSGTLTQMFEYDHSRRFEELVAQANANRVSFYTIDAGGLRVSSSASAESSGEDTQIAGSMSFIDSVRTQNIQSPLHLMAEATGGKAIVNHNRVLDPLERAARDFRNYYSLGYTPAHNGDGRYYDVKVELADKPRGWDVRHRTGYRDKTPEAEMNDGVLAALHFPYYSNPMNLELDFDPGQRRSDGYYQVPVHVRVPLNQLVLVPQGETLQARARLFFAALDEKGGQSAVEQTPLPISLSADELEAGGRSSHYTYTVTLLMRGGGQKVAVGIRDEIAAANSFVSRYVEVGGTAGRGR